MHKAHIYKSRVKYVCTYILQTMLYTRGCLYILMGAIFLDVLRHYLLLPAHFNFIRVFVALRVAAAVAG